LNQFLQYRQPHQLHTSKFLFFPACAHTRASPSPRSQIYLYFLSNRAPPRAHVFFARSSLFLEVAARAAPSPTRARENFSRFWLPLYAQQLLAALLFFDFSLF